MGFCDFSFSIPVSNHNETLLLLYSKNSPARKPSGLPTGSLHPGQSLIDHPVGAPALRHSSVAPSPARAAGEAQDKGCEEGDCCVFGKRGSWEVDYSRCDLSSILYNT